MATALSKAIRVNASLKDDGVLFKFETGQSDDDIKRIEDIIQGCNIVTYVSHPKNPFERVAHLQSGCSPKRLLRLLAKHHADKVRLHISADIVVCP